MVGFFFFGQEMVINNLCSFSSIWAKTRSGPIYNPVETGERCLLCGKPFGEYITYLLPHRQYFLVVHCAQVDATGEHCPYLMEPGLLPRSEADGQLSAARGHVSAVSLSHQHQLSGSALVAPWALLTGLVGDCGGRG